MRDSQAMFFFRLALILKLCLALLASYRSKSTICIFSCVCHVSSLHCLIYHQHSRDQDLHLRETKSKARKSRVRRDFSTRSTSHTSTYRSTPAGWLLVEVKASFGCAACLYVVRLQSALMIFLRKERAGEESKQKISAKVDGGKNEWSAKKKVEEEEEDIRVREVGKRGRDGGKGGSGRKNSALARRARRQDSSSSNPDQPQPGASQPENSRQV